MTGGDAEPESSPSKGTLHLSIGTCHRHSTAPHFRETGEVSPRYKVYLIQCSASDSVFSGTSFSKSVQKWKAHLHITSCRVAAETTAVNDRGVLIRSLDYIPDI
jgi:hypothetical protein